MKPHTIILTLIFSLCLLPVTSAEVMSVESKNGKTMVVSLVSRQGEKIVIKRVKDGKEFTISPDSLSEKSKKMVLSKMKTLKVAYPPLEAAVTIGKRRKPDNGSSYMKEMTITSKVTLSNQDRKVPCPACTMNIIFIGQDQRDTDKLEVLSNQKFKVTPTPEGSLIVGAPFITSYDSDNKGDGNIGGYKYVGYLVVVSSSDNKVIYTKTTSPLVKKALEMNVSAAASIKSYPKSTRLDKNMKKSPDQQILFPRN